MAKQIDKLLPKRSFGMNGGVPYPWHEWLNGQPWQGTLHEDFPACEDLIVVKSLLHKMAYKHGLSCTVRYGGDGIIQWQYFKRVAKSPAPRVAAELAEKYAPIEQIIAERMEEKK